MAGASDKARFYLEQTVPELQDYERKGIFTHPEITAIASKRSDFEHALSGRGSKPSDYARYATYEMNLDSLRKKRCKRTGVKTTTYAGQRTIFFILDRGTKKFPGDLGLWMQYIQFCRKERANKKLARVLTNVLRLRPRDWGMWVLAAKHYTEDLGDMSTARSYLQRGLRFCRDERKLWLEYAKLELVYLAKLGARRKILGLDEPKKAGSNEEEDENMLKLPEVTAKDFEEDAEKGIEEVDTGMLERLAAAPVFTGALPMVIFDAAMKQFMDSTQAAEEFFDLAYTFDQVPTTPKILHHMLDHLRKTRPDSPEVVIAAAKMELFAVQAAGPEFPLALGKSLAVVREGHGKMSGKHQHVLAEKAVMMLLAYLRADEEVDEDVKTVLSASMRRYLRILSQGQPVWIGKLKLDPAAALAQRLTTDGRKNDADMIETHRNAMEIG